MAFADPSFFSVFSFKLKSGSGPAALLDLHSLVLTESTAENSIRHKTNPLGKMIEIKIEDRFEPFTVTGIAEDPPANSSIQFKMLANFNFLVTTKNGARRVNNWHQYSYETYVQLSPGIRLPLDKNTLIGFREKFYPDEETKSRKNGWTGKGPRNFFNLQPLTDIHTDTKTLGGSASVDPKTIWILLAIAEWPFADCLYQFYNPFHWAFC